MTVTLDAPDARAWGAVNGWPAVHGRRGRLPKDLLSAFAVAQGQVPVVEVEEETPAGRFSCRCGNRWNGLRVCCCPSCHKLFTGASGFDAHRLNGYCRPPQAVGLVLLVKSWGEVWGTSEESE